MKSMAVCAVALAVAASSQAQDNRLGRCTTLSFAPLDVNVPACSALIEDPGALDQATLGAVHAARAEAYEFALVYHGQHDVRPDVLLAAALADLDRAVQADSRHYVQRGGVQFQLSRFAEAAASFTAAIAADPASAPGFLERRSMALGAAGDQDGAIDDMTAAIRLAEPGRDRARFTLRRAELREAVGDLAGAIADYRGVMRLHADDRRARDALDRLGADHQ